MIVIETNEKGQPISQPPQAKAVVHKGTFIEYYITEEDWNEYVKKYRQNDLDNE